MVRFQKFILDETGAVATDWVVVTAGVIGISMAGAATVLTGVSGLSDNIRVALTGGLFSEPSYQWRAMTDEPGLWNSIPARREQMAGMTDERLQHEWEYFVLHYFESAMARGYNDICDGCRGASNRLDLMRVVLDEKETRGLATAEHREIMAESERRYRERFES